MTLALVSFLCVMVLNIWATFRWIDKEHVDTARFMLGVLAVHAFMAWPVIVLKNGSEHPSSELLFVLIMTGIFAPVTVRILRIGTTLCLSRMGAVAKTLRCAAMGVMAIQLYTG